MTDGEDSHCPPPLDLEQSDIPRSSEWNQGLAKKWIFGKDFPATEWKFTKIFHTFHRSLKRVLRDFQLLFKKKK